MRGLNLLLNHITTTFGGRLGVLWLAEIDAFGLSTESDKYSIVDKDALTSFLAGYYLTFRQVRDEIVPFVIENILGNPNVPEDMVRLVELEHVACLLIFPIYDRKHIVGTLIIGTESPITFSQTDLDLLKILTSSAVDLCQGVKGLAAAPNKDDMGDSLGLIGTSRQMREIRRTILKVAQSDANVLIHGESGSGKELIARAIHSQSQRKEQAFIPLDCAALPETLLESEMFGYERGAFTGASSTKRGLMEYADKGTLFLDEIANVKVEVQAKLLRVLQEKQFRRVGGRELLNVDIRVISAININPREAIEKNKLREDLYYRLNVIPIEVPPLRDRKEDIALLIERFLDEFSDTNSDQNGRLCVSNEALHYLNHYRWPGNVRQLKNLVERLVALSRSEMISVADLPLEIVEAYSPNGWQDTQFVHGLNYSQAKEQSLLRFERLFFSRLLEEYDGNISRAAKEAQVSRKTIYSILKKHDLSGIQAAGRTQHLGRN